MKRQNIFRSLLPGLYIIRLCIIGISLTGISACSSGPAEKPAPKSISSPAQLLDQGIQQYSDNNYQQAITYFEKSLLQYRSIDSQLGIAQSSLNLAKALMAINNDRLAAEYLHKAASIIKQEKLDDLSEHLQLLRSSLAIKGADYDQALQELEPALESQKTDTRLAALKNRTRIAFIRNDSDKQHWLDRYKTLQQNNTKNTRSHQARILRFEAELTSDTAQQINLLKQSLDLSRQLANRPAIAATLSQWATADISAGRKAAAEDKILRALFIRHQLGDVKNSLSLLEQLDTLYKNTGNKKQSTTNTWINKLSNHDLADWNHLFLDFETYPGIR